MSNPERGKLIPVKGNNDTPENDKAIDVQFNPTSLKVSMSNTLKENQRNANSRASQFVDKSSASLTVELIFDTTYIDQATDQGAGQSDNTATSAGDGESSQGSSANQIEQGSDVRNLTKKIADAFIKPRAASNNRKKAPQRCLFQWGSFEFIGLIESYDETLDFFSKEGRPLRATLSLKLKEDRFQFRQRTDGVAAAQNAEPPTLSPTGNTGSNNEGAGNPGGADNDNGTGSDSDAGPEGEGAEKAAAQADGQSANPVPGSSNGKGTSWRDNALFNGCENPRMPSGSMLALPSTSLSASVNVKASVSASVSASVGITSSLGGGVTTSVNTTATSSSGFSSSVSVSSTNATSGSSLTRVSPAFRFGASTQLGSGIEGAFQVSGNLNQQLNATGVINGSTPLRSNSDLNKTIANNKKTNSRWAKDAGVGFN